MDQDLMEKIEETRAQHEFLTFMIMKDSDDWKCGVVQNSNNRFITFYDLAKIRDDRDRQKFMEYGERWWWESGQLIPIDYFIGREFDVFQEALSTIPRKVLSGDPIGPVYSMTENFSKRVKRRRIDLVNRNRTAA